ncbi:MAG TPA: sulfite exporter TauE/SafE family protein [Xanthobacteraceae bacterium]|nr:sulfite exporter TauE/SafE family protein [Xanthobacteraceae bacterium]
MPQEPPILSLPPVWIAYCCIIMVLAYAARGSTGFGAAAAMPLLGLVIPLKVLIPAWTLIGLAAGVTLLGRDRTHIAWREMVALLPGTLGGIAIGLYVFEKLDAATLARSFGGAVLLYGLWSLWNTFRPPQKWRVPGTAAAAIAGVLGGAVGTTFGTMASLFYAIYFDAIRMSKEQFRASMSAALVALGIVRGLGYFAIDEFNRDVLTTFAVALPMMLIGIFIGDRVHSGLSDVVFRRVVAIALAVSGGALMLK